MVNAAPPADPSFRTERYSAEIYVTQAASLQEISIPYHQMNSVIDNFLQIQATAQPVLDFQLPENLESLPQFEP